MSVLFDYWEYFIPLLAIFGIVTSVEDIREGIIKNKYIIIGCIGGIGIHCVLYFQQILTLFGVIIYLFTILLSIAISIGLYFKEFWSAGDGKLLIAYTCLFPQTLFSNAAEQITIPLTILVNMCIPFFLFGAWKSFSENLTSYKKNKITTTKKEIISDLLFVFSIPWIISELLNLIGIPIPKIIPLLCTMIILIGIEKITMPLSTTIHVIITFFLNLKLVKTNIIIKDEDMQWLAGIIILAPIGIVRIYFEHQTLFTVSIILDLIMYYIIIKLFKQYIRETIILHYTKRVSIRGLKRGMIIQDVIIKTIKISTNPHNQTPHSTKTNSIHHIASLLLKKNNPKKHQNNKITNKIILDNNIKVNTIDNNTNNKHNSNNNNPHPISKTIYSIISEKTSSKDKHERAFIDALSDKDIHTIIEAYRDGRVQFNMLTIKKSMPFAPLALLGIVITITLKGVFGLDFV